MFSGMNIHKSQLFWGSLGTRVLTQTHLNFKQHLTASLHHAEVENWPRPVDGASPSQWCLVGSSGHRQLEIKNPDGDGLKTHKTAEKLVKQCEIYVKYIEISS